MPCKRLKVMLPFVSGLPGSRCGGRSSCWSCSWQFSPSSWRTPAWDPWRRAAAPAPRQPRFRTRPSVRFFNSDNRSIINTQRSIQRRVSILIGTLVSQKNCVWQSHIWRIFSDKTDPFVDKCPNFNMETSCLNAFFELCKFLTVSIYPCYDNVEAR